MSSRPSWEKELRESVIHDDLNLFNSILNRPDVRLTGFFHRKIWFHGHDPLHWAACSGRNQMIHVMLKTGFDVDSLVVNGDRSCYATSLHWAVYNKKSSSVKLLLSRGADVSVRGKWYQHDGTALDWALQREHHHIVRILERHAEAGKQLSVASSAASTLSRSHGDIWGLHNDKSPSSWSNDISTPTVQKRAESNVEINSAPKNDIVKVSDNMSKQNEKLPEAPTVTLGDPSDVSSHQNIRSDTLSIGDDSSLRVIDAPISIGKLSQIDETTPQHLDNAMTTKSDISKSDTLVVPSNSDMLTVDQLISSFLARQKEEEEFEAPKSPSFGIWHHSATKEEKKKLKKEKEKKKKEKSKRKVAELN